MTPVSVVRSMTGAGAFAASGPLGRFEAEARSVNHRFLKVSLRAQGPLPDLTQEVEERVRQQVQRGHVTVTLRFTPAEGARPAARIDPAAFAAAALELRSLAAAADLPPIRTADVLHVPGVLAGPTTDAAPPPELLAAALGTVDGALRVLDQARAREGEALRREVLELLERVERSAAALAARAAEVPHLLTQRLSARLAALLEPLLDPEARRAGRAPLEPEHLAREAALLADKSDVREELTRLTAHVAHARTLLAQPGPVGRALDFLSQELGREANTVGSKSADLAMTRTVIDLKADVERLREQVQNLE